MASISENVRGVARNLWRAVTDRRGGVAITYAFALPIIVMAAGGAVDLQMANTAKRSAQDTVDAAALAAAASSETTKAGVEAFGKKYLSENISSKYINANPTTAVAYDVDKTQVQVDVTGTTPTIFLGIIGFSTLPVKVSATATRGAAQNLELALVLDNTWSMSESAGGGVTKMEALKTAANELVTQLSNGSKDNVKIAVVPYADYVNVGTGNRSQPWVNVPADYSVTTPAKPAPTTVADGCSEVSSKCIATKKGDPKTCTTTTTVDGVTKTTTSDCTPTICTAYEYYNPPKLSCPGPTAAKTTNYKWYGCVGSRTVGTRRLDDVDPTGSRYPGFLSTSQNCLNPILPLTNQLSTVKSNISALIYNIGSYQPSTYIPAGMIWGVNVLSPIQPMTEGKAYDADNTDPRKVIVLMTDGANTMKFNATTGAHDKVSGTAAQQATQVKQTNTDTTAVCNYAKAQKIEVYTVALAVKDADAQTMLEGCATQDGKHYYPASDSAALQKAFADIAASINTIRLIK